MMVPEYMRFYGQTPAQVLGEYARCFFSLANAMYRLKADESIDGVNQVAIGMSGKEGSASLDALRKQSRGLHGIIEEVRIVKE